MDNSGSNRYELLFMDDDYSVSLNAEKSIVNTDGKKISQKSPGAAAKKNQTNKKTNLDKENKAAASISNESNKKPVSVTENISATKSKAGFNGIAADKSRSHGATSVPDESRGFNKRSQNNDIREQRPRRNFRDDGINNAGGIEYNSDQQRPPRQFKERDNRGPPRNRATDVGFRSGKREFDRQSGSDRTGVKSIDKRDGAGAHNWGSAKQDIDDLNKSSTEPDTVLTDKEESGNDQSVEQVLAPEEEETKEFTLDEWKALCQTRNKPQFNIRKAGEGEDTTQWKKMIALNKKKDGDSEDELEYDPSMYPQRVGRLQRIVDIQFNFKDGRRSGFGGFGRGRGRGGIRSGNDRLRHEGGRGNAHGEFADRSNSGRPRNFDRTIQAQPSLKVDDELQFPTLS